jgi:hypothetical protein
VESRAKHFFATLRQAFVVAAFTAESPIMCFIGLYCCPQRKKGDFSEKKKIQQRIPVPISTGQHVSHMHKREGEVRQRETICDLALLTGHTISGHTFSFQKGLILQFHLKPDPRRVLAM